MKTPIKDIIIGERQRMDIGDLSDLDSMSDPDVGQINPIVIDHGNRLIAGRRRLAKATALGWTEVETTYNDVALTEVAKQKVEFFEDIGRKDRSWAEKCVAVCKLHNLISIEKGADGEGWSTRQMASFTGIGETSTKYMLMVGAEILRDPQGEVAQANGYVAAFKVIVGRRRDAAQAEMERRRQAQQPVAASPEGDPQDPDNDEDEEAAPGLGQVLTASAPVEIRLRGFNKVFGRVEQQFNLALLVKPEPELLSALRPALTPQGVAVLWIRHPGMLDQWRSEAENAGFIVQPYPLIWADPLWNGKPSPYPFKMDYGIGLVLFKEKPTMKDRWHSSFISASNGGEGTVPLAVVNHCLEALSLDGDAVLLPCNAPVTEVAECGRVPVFYESDLATYQTKMDTLEMWYLDNVPNAKVIR